MSEAELIALAALAMQEAVQMQGDNDQRRLEGFSPAWREGCGLGYFGEQLREEMVEVRKVVK